jgi:processive 1,2-diacylglycerol beta-glucosyltransferase
MSGSALILSGSIGKGHDSVALACETILSDRGIEVRTLDCMRLLGSAGSAAGDAVFRRILSIPTVYDGFHFGHLRNGSRLAASMDALATNRLVPKLREQLGRGRGSKLLLAVFPTGAAAAGRLKREMPQLATVALCTDACAHRMWIHDGIDAYLVGSRLTEVTLRRYQPRANVAVLPPPVRAEFYDAPPRNDAREALGLAADNRCVLVMAGGWGLGPLAESARQLARTGFEVLAVAGLNEELRARLERVSAEEPRVRPFGFTERVPELMAAADVVVTSPGQTCHEARVVGRPLVLLDVVPGHGRENALHEIESGGAFACSPFPDSVVGVVEAILARPLELPKWPVASAQEWGAMFLATVEGSGVELGDSP